MADAVALAIAVVDALDQRDMVALRRFVPERYWDWLDEFLDDSHGWLSVDDLAGSPRRVGSTRLLDSNMARLALDGPLGSAFVTVTFDADDTIKGFALHGEEYEGIGTIVITCPDERTDELRAFYAALITPGLRTRPRLHFDEGRDYRPPSWPDPQHPTQMHLDIRVRDLGASHRRVLERGGEMLADSGTHRVYADPIGHPFCLYPGPDDGLWRVVIDCANATELSAFYNELLGPEPVPELAFQELSPYLAPRWPDPAFPPQMHFDVKVDNRVTVEERIARAGAVRLAPQGGSCPVWADPAGHPFCLCLPGE